MIILLYLLIGLALQFIGMIINGSKNLFEWTINANYINFGYYEDNKWFLMKCLIVNIIGWPLNLIAVIGRLVYLIMTLIENLRD